VEERRVGVRLDLAEAASPPRADDLPYAVSTVDRAIDVLEAFSHKSPELSLKQIAARTGLHKATAFRLVTTLVRRGLMIKHPLTGQYRLGFELISLAEIAKGQTSLVAEALPVMRQVRDQLNETVFLCVRVGDHRVDIEQVEGLQNIRRVLTLGEQKSLYAGAGSKVLLAAMADDAIAAYLGRTKLVALTKTTPTTGKAVWTEIHAIRRQGYAEGWDERDSGGAGAAAPIFGPSLEAVGALAIAVPTSRYSAALKKKTIVAVTKGAAAISLRLGAPPRRELRGAPDA
jgi:DNA-binding IclR family transcriptional regulator